MPDLGTVPKGDAQPYMDQLPARNVFDHPEKYTVRQALGNQQEKKYHDSQHGKLRECEVPFVFPDRQSLHPTSKAPEEYFGLIDIFAAEPKSDYLLPWDGHRAEFIMPGVSSNNHETTEDVGEIDNEHIATYFSESVCNVHNDSSIESKKVL